MDQIVVSVYTTHITISQSEKVCEILEPLLNLLTYEDEFAEEEFILGYMTDEENDLLYLNRGVDLNYIRRLLGNYDVLFDVKSPDEHEEMLFEYEEIVPPRDNEQKDIIDFITGTGGHQDTASEHQMFVVARPGFGKAQPNSARIPSPDSQFGFKLMGDIKVGDHVFDQNGKPTEVIEVIEQGSKIVYSVKFEDERISRCCDKHLWDVKTTQIGKKYQTLTMSDMIQNVCEREDMYIPMCKPVEYRYQYIPVDPWALGVMLTICRLTSVYLTMITYKKEIVEKFAKIMGFRYVESRKRKGTYNFINNETGTSVTTAEIINPCFDHFMFDRLNESFIPNKYKFNTIETRMNLVRGMFDSNSIVHRNIFDYDNSYYHSSSKRLIEDLAEIIYSLGLSCIIDDGAIVHNHTITVHNLKCVFKHRDMCKLFTVKNPKLKYSNRDCLRISSIEPTTTEDCRCIVVDNPDHLYLGEDYVVTHNTYCSSVGLCTLGLKTLIVVHRTSLADQWISSLKNMVGMTSKEIRMLSSEDMFDAAYNRHDFDNDVYIITHASFRSAVKRIGNIPDASNIFKNLKIGIKIIDEAHLEFRNTLLIDFLTNIDNNIYLTATDGRSSKEQNSIFKHVFANAKYYKPSAMYLTGGEMKRWVEYIYVAINTNVSPAMYRFKVDGGMKGMNAISYGKWVICKDQQNRHLKCCRDLLKAIYQRDENAKVFVFMPLIELCTEAAYFFRKELDYDEEFGLSLNIKTINSKNTKQENEYNQRADVIISTVQSVGTGTDIKGITDIICCSPFVSSITAKQVWGRIRYCGKQCHYYDIVDQSVLKDKIWAKSRGKTFKALATNSRSIAWEEEIPVDNSK